MQRLTDINQERVQYWRDELKRRADEGSDDDLTDERDRSNREHVAYYQTGDGEWHPTALKRDDHVRIADVFDCAIVGPARDRRTVAVYNQNILGDTVAWFEWTTVTDRAPLDDAEQAMPIVPPEQ